MHKSLGCCHGSPSAVEKSGPFQRLKPGNEMEAVGTPAAEASVTFAKDFWEDFLGMGALDGGQ